LGMHPQASEGIDSFDDFNIPRFFDFLELKYSKHFHDMSYTKDVVPTGNEYVWNFNTETNQPGTAIILEWDNSYFGNGSEQLWLMDLETGRVWDMRKENKAQIDYAAIRKWRVAFGSEGFVKDATLPDHNSLVAVYPSPFNSEVSFDLAIAEPSPIKLEILDLNGKSVWTLISQHLDKGRYISKWGGSNIVEETPSGVYIIRFESGSIVQHLRIMKN
jgi:hypothetical protein